MWLIQHNTWVIFYTTLYAAKPFLYFISLDKIFNTWNDQMYQKCFCASAPILLVNTALSVLVCPCVHIKHILADLTCYNIVTFYFSPEKSSIKRMWQLVYGLFIYISWKEPASEVLWSNSKVSYWPLVGRFYAGSALNDWRFNILISGYIYIWLSVCWISVIKLFHKASIYSSEIWTIQFSFFELPVRQATYH